MAACDISGFSGHLAAVGLRHYHWRKPTAAASMVASSASSSTEGGSLEGRRMFVFGMGFVGRYVSTRLRGEGWEVSGTCTSVAKKKELEEMGFNAFVFDASENELKHLNALQHATHLLISIPPIANLGDPLLFLQDLHGSLSRRKLQWLGYLSSTRNIATSHHDLLNTGSSNLLKPNFHITGVYGDYGGAWVNEDCQANPVSQTAKARLSAEQGWLDLGRDLGTSTYVFRLGGIYGPGRSALDTIINHEALSKYQKMRDSRKYTARVHVADIYQTINASFTIPSTGRVYNVVDDDPAPRAEVFAFAQDLIEERWPGMIKRSVAMDTTDPEMRQDDMKGEKRVSNARLKDLGVSLIHPSYRSGLRSILDSWESPLQ